MSLRKFVFISMALIVASMACITPAIVIPDTGGFDRGNERESQPAAQVTRSLRATSQAAVPTLPAAVSTQPAPAANEVVPGMAGNSLVALHEQLADGVVNIQTYTIQMGQSGEGAGSGFILDSDGHIVTNNHVVAGADRVVVVFYDGTEMDAEVIGTDDDSDLAVVKVASLPEGAHPIDLGDSSNVKVGEWVIAIGNPFGLSSSMTVGIVSAIGRTIESGVTPFSIAEAIQTDAAINPGNSGGPLINLSGQVIGVNAQIATNPGVRANAGVGFAIPSNVVRKVAPALIQNGVYEWPWLGVQGAPVNLTLMRANRLERQTGAYIDQVVPGGAAQQAGLQGSSGSTTVNGIESPTGGDVVIAIDGKPVKNFNDLMVEIANHNPGDTVTLTVLRNGEQLDLPVTLAPRPQSFTQDNTDYSVP